ncbi:MAG TPA: hypothetical protein VFL69_04260 [Marmoricola sp.]|nr:hypothetical protein [Marmoricola sp.]
MNSLTKAALGVAAARTAFGIYALAEPGRMARSWLGPRADGVTGHMFGRTLGVRDLALGATAIWAVVARPQDRPLVTALVAAGAAADSADAAATFAAWGQLPSPWKQVAAGMALSGAVTGGIVAGLKAA